MNVRMYTCFFPLFHLLFEASKYRERQFSRLLVDLSHY